MHKELLKADLNLWINDSFRVGFITELFLRHHDNNAAMERHWQGKNKVWHSEYGNTYHFARTIEALAIHLHQSGKWTMPSFARVSELLREAYSKQSVSLLDLTASRIHAARDSGCT